MKKIGILVIIAVAFTGMIGTAHAGGGHYQGNYTNVRDFVSPPVKGFVALVYNPFYWSSEYRGDNGKKLQPISDTKSYSIRDLIHIDATVTADIDVDIASYAINPIFFYFSDFKILGAKYACGIGPSYNYVYAKLNADVTGTLKVNGREVASATRNIKIEDSDSGFGDMMVRPLMLDWSGERYDIVASYEFFAPTGHFAENKLANVGLGYWSHEFAVGGLYYFDKTKMTCLLLNATYEINTRMTGKDVYPGQNIILEYGVEHFFYPNLEVALTGSSEFQVTDDWGSQARNKSQKLMVHSVGGEFDWWVVPDKLSIGGRYFYQYYAENDLIGSGANATARIIF